MFLGFNGIQTRGLCVSAAGISDTDKKKKTSNSEFC